MSARRWVAPVAILTMLLATQLPATANQMVPIANEEVPDSRVPPPSLSPLSPPPLSPDAMARLDASLRNPDEIETLRIAGHERIALGTVLITVAAVTLAMCIGAAVAAYRLPNERVPQFDSPPGDTTSHAQFADPSTARQMAVITGVIAGVTLPTGVVVLIIGEHEVADAERRGALIAGPVAATYGVGWRARF